MDALAHRRPPRLNPSDPQVDRGALIDLRKIAAIIRRRWMVICAALLTAIVLATIAYFSAERRYTAKAQVALERTAERVINVDQVTPTVDPDSAAVDTEVEILRSPELIGRVVDRLRLDLDPEFNQALVPGLVPTPPNAAAKPDPTGRQRAIGTVLSNLAVKRDGLSYAISVTFEAGSAQKSAQVTNAIIEQYVSGQTGTKTAATRRAQAFLEQRLQRLRGQVLEAEKAIADYRGQHGLFAASASSSTSQEELSNLSTQLAQAQAESAAAQARLATARAQLQRGRSGDELGESLDSPVVSQLRGQRAQTAREVASLEKRYGPRHPDLIRAQNALASTDKQISAEVERIVANVSIQANIASQRAASLSASIGQARGRLATDNQASVRLNELERNAESSRTLYQAFLDRYRQTVAQAGLERSDSYIVSEARVPGAPSSPNGLIFGALALVGGVGMATLLVLLLQLLERGLESSDIVERSLSLPMLSSIPDARTLPGYRKSGLPAPPTQLPIERPQSAFAEAFRTLRTSIQFAGGGSVRVVALTSAIPGEGKTTTTVALARAAAMSGARVLMIDCDARRRSLTQQFSDRVEVGLNDVLSGKVSFERAILQDDISSAVVLPQPLNAADVHHADSDRLAELIEFARSRYDLILLDTPPVLALDEARIFASVADGVVLLVRWRKTAAKAVEIALRQLHDVHANVIGAVLTLVDIGEQQRSGFDEAGYHLREYKSYYVD